MPRYIATIRHSSISSARSIAIDGSLAKAKQAATREFGNEQRDYIIVIYEDDGDEFGRHNEVASRAVCEGPWTMVTPLSMIQPRFRRA